MKIGKRQQQIKYLFVFSLITVLFLVLYNKFILRDYVYVYSIPGDIGSDTINSYYPILGYISNSIHNANFDIFTLQSGMGMDMSYLYSYFCNPVDIVAALFPTNILHVGILVSTYLKLLIIAMFSFGFFSIHQNNKIGIIISTITWTFCSFTIIWGQHYVFCTQMMNFTIFMFLLQKWLMGSKKSLLLLIPFMSFFLINNYYFFYMTGVFSAIYVIVYMLLNQEKLMSIMTAVLKLAGSAALAIGLGMMLFLPILYSFTNSTRGEGLFNLDFLLQLIKPYWSQLIATDIGRFLNPDMVGDGYTLPWTGSSNYYESAFLSTSVLSVYAIVYELFFTKKKGIKRVIFGFIIICLMFPIFTYFMTFNHLARRWTFCLLFIICLIIGKFVESVYVQDSKDLKKIAIIGTSVVALLFVFLFIAQNNGFITLTNTSLMVVAIISVLYFLIMVNRGFTSTTKIRSIFVVLTLEIIVANYPAINKRGVEKSEQFQNHYQDGTVEAIQFLREKDDSLYRISKTYTSVFLNDSLIQEYNGFNSYSSVNPKEAWDIAQFYDGEYNGHPNYINYNSPLFQNILGSKYILSKRLINDLELIDTISDINIYKNRFEIPFGFMYSAQLDEEELMKLPVMDRITALTQGFIASENMGIAKQKVTIDKEYEDIASNLVQYINCTSKNDGDIISLLPKKDDIQLIFNFPSQVNTEANPVDSIKLIIEVENKSELQIYFDTGNGFNESESTRVAIEAGENLIEMPISNFKNFSNMRLDPVNDMQKVEVKALDFVKANQLKIEEDVDKLKMNGLEDVYYHNSELQGKVDNITGQSQMLMVPITFSKNWSAQIDDGSVEIVKINNGFIGIMIPEGQHRILIKYHIPYFLQGSMISLASLAIFILIVNKRKLIILGEAFIHRTYNKKR